MTAGRFVDRTRDDDAAFEEERARWEAAETAEEAFTARFDRDLLALLRDAGKKWGPLGVALAAAHLTEPHAVVARLLTADHPAASPR